MHLLKSAAVVASLLHDAGFGGSREPLAPLVPKSVPSQHI